MFYPHDAVFARHRFAPISIGCYRVTTMLFLDITSGLLPRLGLAVALAACIWLLVLWALGADA